eukprot:Sdes_comp15597_c0_seq1m4582
MFSPEFLCQYVKTNWHDIQKTINSPNTETLPIFPHASDAESFPEQVSPHRRLLYKNLIIEEVVGAEHHNVRRVYDTFSRKSIILKMEPQVDTTKSHSVRSPRDTLGVTLEFEALVKFNQILESCVPFPYLCDETHGVCMMEDLFPHISVKDLLASGQTFELSESLVKLGRYLSNLHSKTCIDTSLGESCLCSEESLELIRLFGNEISSQYIAHMFCELPFFMQSLCEFQSKNSSFASLLSSVRQDSTVMYQVNNLKSTILTCNQVLCHGDLCVDSLMVWKGSLKILDCEYAFMGPRSFDLGRLFGSLALVYLIQSNISSHHHDVDSIISLMGSIWDSYQQNMKSSSQAQEKTHSGFVDVESVVGFAALEIIQCLVCDENYINVITNASEASLEEKHHASVAALETALILLRKCQSVFTFQLFLDTLKGKCHWLY